MEPHRLRAPAVDGGLLAEPPLAEAGRRLAANREELGRWDHDFQGRRVGRLRAMVRQQVFARARAYHERMGLDAPGELDAEAPLIVTGHQPELFHPGVWVKNFAVAAIAREGRGVALNLIVDNDTPKRAAIRVPHPTDSGLRSSLVDFDDWAGEVPYEDLPVRNAGLFDSVRDRVVDRLGGQVADPLIEEFWPLALRAGAATDRLGGRLAIARRSVEARWGVRNVEVPLSWACETDGFLWFAAHLLAQLPRFQAVHNAALGRYRRLYHIRSRHHPVPALGREGDWLEAPFWAWRAESPRRRPLLARQVAGEMEIRIAGESSPLLALPLGPDREACCAVEALRTLADRRVRLRTRALTTTMFARLLLGDLFLHGIGGAKYDELGDEIVRGFFGVEPPPYLTLSLTLRLGLPEAPATAERLRAVERGLRDLAYNPDRHLAGPVPAELRAWVDAKRAALAGPVGTHAERLARFREVRRCNEALQAAVAAERGHLEAERAELAAGLRRNTIAGSRDYAAVLHARGRLRSAFAAVAPSAFGPA